MKVNVLKGTLVCLAGLAIGGAVVAEEGTAAIDRADPIAGKQVYQQNCAACHGADGKGALPGTSDFATSDRLFDQGWEVVFRHVSGEHPSPDSPPMPMPPRGGKADLTDQDLWNVLAYIRQAFRKGK
jgi:mono/diheme cytochrome c family protein